VNQAGALGLLAKEWEGNTLGIVSSSFCKMIITKQKDGFLKVILPDGIVTWAKDIDDVSVALSELTLCLQLYKYSSLV
jgi:hypothetical protein